MKRIKKAFVLSLSLLSLLTSCSSRNEEEWKKSINSCLPSVKELSYSSYSVKPSGEVYAMSNGQLMTFSSFNEPKPSYTLPSGKHISDKDTNQDFYDIGSSYLMLIPIRISNETFLSTGEIDEGSGYKVLNEMLCYYADPVTKLQFKKNEDGSFEFYTTSVSKLIEFRHLYNEKGPDSEYIQAYGRFNMTAKYSSDGLLQEEIYQTVDYKAKKEGACFVKCVYTYNS